MASTRNRKSEFQLDIQYYHNQWCLDNGYPVNSYKPQAGRPKRQASSFKHLKSQASNLHRQTSQQ